MARPKSDDKDKPLTDAELHLMNILWEQGTLTVHQAQEELSNRQNKEFAYTTVSTMLRILEKKEAVAAHKEGRGHKYSALLPKAEYQKKITHKLVEQVYSGQKTSLIRNLLGDSKLSPEELDEIKKLIKENS